jgi:branched-chain amino acid transport system substrate-binding protein
MGNRWVRALVVGMLVVAGCGPSGGPAGGQPAAQPKTGEAGKEITVGFHAPLTGDAAADGASAVAGAELGIEAANAAGPVVGGKLALVKEDDQAKPDQGPIVAQKLLDSKAAAVIGGSYSGPSRSAGPIFQRNGTPYVVAYAVHPEITKAGDYVFRLIFVGPIQGQAMAEYATGKMNLRTIAMLNADNDYGKSIAEGFTAAMTKAGGTVPVARTFQIGQKDFAALLTQIKDASPEALYIAGYYAEASQIVQQARALGITVPFLASDGVDSPKFIELGGAAAEGTIFTSDFSRSDPRPIVEKFVNDYKARTGNAADSLAATSYDAALLIGDAMRRANSTDGAQIKKALQETKGFEGVTGAITFDKDREVQKTVYISRVEQGDFKYVDKIEPKQESRGY